MTAVHGGAGTSGRRAYREMTIAAVGQTVLFRERPDGRTLAAMAAKRSASA